MCYYRKERRGGSWGDRTTEVPNRSHLCDALHVINRNGEETGGRILLSRMSGEMVSVYLLNLIIYISLNPIKLALYHVKIALGWLSPARLSYCWRGPDPVPGAVVFPKYNTWLQLGCSSMSHVLVMEASCGPSKGDGSTLSSCLRSVTEMSQKSAGLFNFFPCSWGLIESYKCVFMIEGSFCPVVEVGDSNSSCIMPLYLHLLRIWSDMLVTGIFWGSEP